MKRLITGIILLILGYFLSSPVDNILISFLLSILFGSYILEIILLIGYLCFFIGVYTIGKSPFLHNPINKNLWIFASIIITIIFYVIRVYVL